MPRQSTLIPHGAYQAAKDKPEKLEKQRLGRQVLRNVPRGRIYLISSVATVNCSLVIDAGISA
jgi:hypothetical protein